MNEKANGTAVSDIANKDSLAAMLEFLHGINERAKVIALPKEADNGVN